MNPRIVVDIKGFQKFLEDGFEAELGKYLDRRGTMPLTARQVEHALNHYLESLDLPYEGPSLEVGVLENGQISVSWGPRI